MASGIHEFYMNNFSLEEEAKIGPGILWIGDCRLRIAD
jgi:hypothetical protein